MVEIGASHQLPLLLATLHPNDFGSVRKVSSPKLVTGFWEISVLKYQNIICQKNLISQPKVSQPIFCLSTSYYVSFQIYNQHKGHGTRYIVPLINNIKKNV